MSRYNFLIENKEWFFGIIASLSAFFGGRKSKEATDKKAMASAESAELQNLSTVRLAEKQLIQDMRTHLTELAEINNELKNIIAQKDEVIKEYKAVMERQKKTLERCKINCGI